MSEEFELTEQHLTLLKNAYVRWDDMEAGAPGIDPKRPYGNSDVAGDVARLLGIEVPDDAWDIDPELTERLMTLHNETEPALEIVVRHGHVLGRYTRRGSFWERVSGENQKP